MQKIRNQHKMRRSSSRARQPAKCVPSHRLPAFLGALLLVSSSISFDTTAKSNTVFVSATVSSSSMSFFGKRSTSKTNTGTAASSMITATQTPPRGGAASTSASFAGLDADTLRSLGVDESEIGDLFLDETDGEFAAPGVSSRRQRAVERNPVVEDEEEEEYEWESDGDDEDAMESAEEEYDDEEEEPDAPADAFDQDYDFEEYEEYEDDDEDVGEEWWRNPLGRYQNDADEYDDVEEESEYDDEPSSIEEILGEEEDEEEEEAQPTQRGRNSANKKSRAAASAKGKKPSIGLPTFGGKKKASKSSSAVVKRKNSKAKSSVATTSSSSWSVPTPLGKVKVQLPAAAALGPLTTLVGSLLAKTSPTVPIILSLGLANYLLGLVRSMHPQDSAEEDVDQEYQQYNDGYQDEMNEEDYGWDQQQQEQGAVSMDGDGDFDEYQQQEQYPEDDVDSAKGPGVLERLANSMPKVPSMFGRGDQTNDGEYQEQKPSRRMMRRMRRNRKRSFRRDDEVQALYERAETAEAERDTIEREYELSSKQLQGMQQQVQAISKTNTYLKAQLRDIQRSSESAVLAERKKADEEMARVRESLVDVLERERRLMRAQMMKASNRLRTLMEDEADALSEDDGQFAK